MKTYLLDTNIAINFVRNSPLFETINDNLNLLTGEHLILISEVTIGELLSIAKRNKWGAKKINRLEAFLQSTDPILISYPDIHEAYADIDAYSQSKHPTLSLPQGMTARNMGKNDVWIAATAYVLRATLVTTDKDFDHLQHFFGLEWVEQ